EAGTLLVRPVDHADGQRRLPVLRDPAQHFDCRHDVQAAVEPAAVRHRVDVPTEEQRALRVALEREPLVPRLIDLLDRAGVGHRSAEPLACTLPRLGPRDALRPVLVSGEVAQLLRRAATVAAAALALVGFWELYRWIWTSAGWTWPFVVDRTSMPHVWTIFRAFGQPTQVNQPALITILFHKSVFTGKEALVGFAVGAIVGFAIGIVLAHSRLLQRGFLPYIVASQ